MRLYFLLLLHFISYHFSSSQQLDQYRASLLSSILYSRLYSTSFIGLPAHARHISLACGLMALIQLLAAHPLTPLLCIILVVFGPSEGAMTRSHTWCMGGI